MHAKHFLGKSGLSTAHVDNIFQNTKESKKEILTKRIWLAGRTTDIFKTLLTAIGVCLTDHQM